jgi:hypothetical protein
MEDPVNRLLGALREAARAHARLSRGVPDPRRAEAAADAAFGRVMALFDDPAVGGALDGLLPPARDKARADPGQFAADLAARRAQMLPVEAAATRRAGVKGEDIERFYRMGERGRWQPADFPDGVQALRRQLTEAHVNAKRRVSSSRSMPRKPKKKTKRKVAQAIASAVFGAAAIVANTQLPAVFAFSYGLGGAALHQALRDLVGEPAE